MAFLRPAIVILTATRLLLAASAQDKTTVCDIPLTLELLSTLIKGGVSEKRIVSQYIAPCAVDFSVTPDVERRLRELGASEVLIGALLPPESPSPSEVWKSPVDRREMVWIIEGTFRIGSLSDEPGRDRDEQAHAVQILRGFWLDTNEVTYESYRRFLLANPQWQKSNIDRTYHDGNYLEDWRGNDFPQEKSNWSVVNVSWYSARAYAAWAGKRLPTEAEWEYACRARSATAYWWGNSFDSRHVNSAIGLTIGAGSKLRRNPWGLADMSGNVWEWTSSRYVDYPYRADDGREDPNVRGPRVVRGGSSASGAQMLRSANRNPSVPERCDPLVGFRCAR